MREVFLHSGTEVNNNCSTAGRSQNHRQDVLWLHRLTPLFKIDMVTASCSRHVC